MSPWFTPTLSIFLLLSTVAQASAQALPSPLERRLVIERTCARQIERYCPDLAGTGQRRNQVICLKPYRLDLSLPCRRAVNTALR